MNSRYTYCIEGPSSIPTEPQPIPMSRFSRYDTDEGRLPDGMSRVGYDSDTQVYTYQDSDGSYWESPAGHEYGQLTRVGGDTASDNGDMEPFLVSDQSYEQTSWRAELMPLLNFGVIVGLCLLLFFWYLHYAASPSKSTEEPGIEISCSDNGDPYTITDGDTCWSVAEKLHITTDDILRFNVGLDCQKLQLGSHICVPHADGPV